MPAKSSISLHNNVKKIRAQAQAQATHFTFSHCMLPRSNTSRQTERRIGGSEQKHY